MAAQPPAPAAFGASVRAMRPRAGLPNLRKYDSGQLAPRFEAIARALRAAGHAPERAGERELSRLTGRLLAFCDAALGRDAPLAARATLTKLPARVFYDYRPDGPLCCILDHVLRYAAERGWRDVDLRNLAMRAEHVEMLRAATRALRINNMLPAQMVYLAPTLEPQEIDALARIVQAHGGVAVSTVDVATHVVYPDPPGTLDTQTDSQILLRLLKLEGKPGGLRALVHWWYHPDSYDDWIMAREISGAVDVAETPRNSAPWHIQARWIRDSHMFNEWMNERDYEMPDTFQDYIGMPPQHVIDAKTREKYATNGFHSNVRLRLHLPTDTDETPAAKRIRVTQDSVSMAGLPGVAHETTRGEAGNGPSLVTGYQSSPPADSLHPWSSVSAGGLSSQWQDNSAAGDDEDDTAADAPGVANLRPKHALWFTLGTVHDIERRALPEFFSGQFPSKTEGTYMEIRNFMVRTFVRTPSRYMTATAARRHLRGDACAIHRVHTFLEHWGIINHDVDPDTRPEQVIVPPPPPLPVKAGRTGDDCDQRQALLFLRNGCPVDIHENRVRRVHLDGKVAPDIQSQVTISGLGVSVLGAVRDFGGESGVSDTLMTPSDSADVIGRGSSARAGNKRADRPSRSTRYSSRRKRVSRYTVDNSSEDEEDEDDDLDDDRADENTEKVDNPREPSGNEHPKPEKEDHEGGDSIEYHCDVCTRDCSKIRYHCATRADMDLCPQCYTDGKYPPTMQARDFIRMTAAPPGRDADGSRPSDPLVWSESETLLLLEALEMYGDSWDLIAEHVESKDHIQCVRQFLRMPIEDRFLSALRNNWWPVRGVIDGDIGNDVSSSRSSKPGGSAGKSPVEALEFCNMKENPIEGSSSWAKTLTGKAPVFANAGDAVTPQVAVMSSLVPSEVVSAILEDLRDARVDHTSGEDNVGVKDGTLLLQTRKNAEESLSTKFYKKSTSEVPFAQEIASSAEGVEAGKTAFDFFSTSKEGARNETELTPDAMTPNTTNNGSPADRVTKTPSKFNTAEHGVQSSTATRSEIEMNRAAAAVALVAAAVRAQSLAAIDDAECKRLYVFLHELKLDIIRLKLEHLQDLYGHGNLSKHYAEKARCKEFAYDCSLAKAQMSLDAPTADKTAITVHLEAETEPLRRTVYNDDQVADSDKKAAPVYFEPEPEFCNPSDKALSVRTTISEPPVTNAPVASAAVTSAPVSSAPVPAAAPSPMSAIIPEDASVGRVTTHLEQSGSLFSAIPRS